MGKRFTVGNLIQALQQLPAEAEVFTLRDDGADQRAVSPDDILVVTQGLTGTFMVRFRDISSVRRRLERAAKQAGKTV